MSNTNQQPEDLNQALNLKHHSKPENPDETILATDTEKSDEKSEWQLKAEEYLTDLQRLQADFENYKKRVKNDEHELYGHLSGQIASDLMPVLDNLHAAVEHVPAEAAASPWVTGITYIEKQFEEALKNYGVEPITVKPGDAFDPAKHEALSNEQKMENSGQASVETLPQTIAKVMQKGYQIKDRVIRPAKVIVN